jgi:hypothetical protein
MGGKRERLSRSYGLLVSIEFVLFSPILKEPIGGVVKSLGYSLYNPSEREEKMQLCSLSLGYSKYIKR